MFCCAFMWKSGGEDLQGFYPVRRECQSDVPRTRFKSRVVIWSWIFFCFHLDMYELWMIHDLSLSQAGKTLSARRWHAAFTEDGHLDMEKVLRRIQRGVCLLFSPYSNCCCCCSLTHFFFLFQGIHPSIKGAVWEFLSGCYDPDSTFDERTKLRDLRRY